MASQGNKQGKSIIQKQGQTSGSFGNNPGAKEVNKPATPIKPC